MAKAKLTNTEQCERDRESCTVQNGALPGMFTALLEAGFHFVSTSLYIYNIFASIIIFTQFVLFRVTLAVYLASPLKVTCSQFVNVVFSCFLSYFACLLVLTYLLLLNKIRSVLKKNQ